MDSFLVLVSQKYFLHFWLSMEVNCPCRGSSLINKLTSSVALQLLVYDSLLSPLSSKELVNCQKAAINWHGFLFLVIHSAPEAYIWSCSFCARGSETNWWINMFNKIIWTHRWNIFTTPKKDKTVHVYPYYNFLNHSRN